MKKILKPRKAKENQSYKILGFDIETYGDKNEFVLACFYGDSVKHICYTKQEVVEFINQSKLKNYKIFATNLAFDFLGTLYDQHEKWKIAERNGVIYSFSWYQDTKLDKEKGLVLCKPVHFFDTLRIFPASVEKLGNILKIPKMQHPKCFGNKPKNEDELCELAEYCLNDAKISYEFIKQIVVPFCIKYNIPLKKTIGSMALADFITNDLDEVLFQEPKEKREMGFKSYYGGRTETFLRGTFENVYCFDINSLYPSVMINEMPHPNRSRHLEAGTLYNINTYEGVSEVLVEVPENMYIPPLPLKRDGKLIFPTGTFKGYYNHNELRNALKHGVRILEVYEQLVYTKTKAFFKSFVERHYAERLRLQKEKSPMELMEKLALNNLYGKFAYNYKESSMLVPAHAFEYDKHVKDATYIEPLCNDAFVSVRIESDNAPVYSFPIWSSYITSYARIKMYEYLSNKALHEKIIATDTDSIFIRDYANEIPTSNLLGAMKLEDGYPIETGIFIRPKMYLTHKPKCKGVQFREEPHETFMNILHGKKIKQERFTKYRTAVRSQEHHKTGVLVPNQILQVTKRLDLEDTKRNWFESFDYQDQQMSTPLQVNYYKEKEVFEREVYEQMYESLQIDLTGEDTYDHKGTDITKQEYLANEIFFETL